MSALGAVLALFVVFYLEGFEIRFERASPRDDDRFDAPRGLRPDQPGIIYGFEQDGEERAVRLVRSGEGRPGPSPGDIVDLDEVPDRLDQRLPEAEIPGRRELQDDDCGEDFPAFGCRSCGAPLYVGRTCAGPLCGRCWAASVKETAVTMTARLEAMRRVLYARYNGRKDIDFNHVVASLPTFLVDSKDPVKRATLVLKELLRANWGVEDFVWIYHPWRIKKEYRKDKYEHWGEPGEGDMTWKDVMNQPDWREYVYFAPHFHIFFPAPRRSFDYRVTEAVEDQSGWVFHRIEKENSRISVEDFEDLAHQYLYAISHVGVVKDDGADRAEKISGYKGFRDLKYVPDEVVDRATAAVCEAAPDLLGVTFSRANECNEEVPAGEGVDTETNEFGQPVPRVDEPVGPGGHPRPTVRRMTDGGRFIAGAGMRGMEVSYGEAESADEDVDDVDEDCIERCGGELVPIWEAADLLEDDDWRLQAAHADGLERAVKAWKRSRLDREDLPEHDGAIPPPTPSFIE